MKNIIKVTLFSVLSGAITFNALANDAHHAASHLSDQQPANESIEQKIISSKGVVKKIDTEEKKLTIAHEAIPSVNWPAMTMRFTYENPSIIADIKEGSEVDIDFIQQGNISLLTKITATQ